MTNLNRTIFARAPEGEEGNKGIESVWGNNCWKLPQSGEGNRHSDYGSAESPLQKEHQDRIIKMVKIKDKERVLEVAIKRKKITYTGNLIRLSSGFSINQQQLISLLFYWGIRLFTVWDIINSALNQRICSGVCMPDLIPAMKFLGHRVCPHST